MPGERHKKGERNKKKTGKKKKRKRKEIDTCHHPRTGAFQFAFLWRKVRSFLLVQLVRRPSKTEKKDASTCAGKCVEIARFLLQSSFRVLLLAVVVAPLKHRAR